MKEDKPVFIVHDPNPPDVTVQYLLTMLLESNAHKAEGSPVPTTQERIA